VAGELEPLRRSIFERLRRKDVDAVGLMTSVGDVHTELRDVRESVSGDSGVLTCRLEQDYTLEGKSQHVSAPTTVLFRRREERWKMALFHSIPLPDR